MLLFYSLIFITGSSQEASFALRDKDTVFIAQRNPVVDLVLEAEIKVPDSSKRNTVDALLRYQADGSKIVLRYNDRSGGFEVLSYDKGNLLTDYDLLMAITRECDNLKISFQKERWYKWDIALNGY